MFFSLRIFLTENLLNTADLLPQPKVEEPEKKKKGKKGKKKVEEEIPVFDKVSHDTIS